tara:strand:- start:1664 stop:2254 length:591 start_codon:yes stop_codon:yes gene_type:complete
MLLILLNTSCSFLPLSDPSRDLSNHSNGIRSPGLKTFSPSLQKQEFLETSTYTDGEGRLYSAQNKTLLTGTLVAFHRTGKKKYEINYIEGLREGSAQWWTSNGLLKHLRNYHKGRLSGSWIEYYVDSEQKKQEQIYDNGVEIMRQGWWPNGSKKFKIVFENGEEKSRQSWDALEAAPSNIPTPDPLLPKLPSQPEP